MCSNLCRQFFRRLGAGLDKIRNSELSEAGDARGKVKAMKHLEHADEGWHSLGSHSPYFDSESSA
jgi:hypothetical protein